MSEAAATIIAKALKLVAFAIVAQGDAGTAKVFRDLIVEDVSR